MLITNTPYFWKKKFHLFTLVLLPFSLIYFFLIKLNKIKFFFQPKIKIKTICVGNINIGGTGKTPLVKKIYDELKINQKCCILKKFRCNQIDEIKLLNAGKDLFTPKRRIDGLREAELQSYNSVIIDDGMQDYSFKKDISILCIKSRAAFGNQFILPAGPLREPLAEIKQYNIAVINGDKNKNLENILKRNNQNIKIFYSNYVIKNIGTLKSKKFLAFSGIADNQSFFIALKENDVEVLSTKEFSDHHKFTEQEISKLINEAKIKNIELITTDKNYNNIPEKFKDKIYHTILDVKINNKTEFLNEIN